MHMTSTVRCRPCRRQPGLLLGLGGMIGSVTAQTTSSTARPWRGANEPPDVVCSGSFSHENQLYYAQAVFSSLSIVMCLAVMAVLCKGVHGCA